MTGWPRMAASTVEESGLQRHAQQAGVGLCLLAERDDARDAGGFGGFFQPRILRVVAVEHRGAAGLDAQEDLGLGVGDFFQRAEKLQMHRRDGGDDGDVRAHEFGERRDLAGMVHADLEHGIFRASAGQRASDSGTPQ